MKKKSFLLFSLILIAGLVYPGTITVNSPQSGKTYLTGKLCKIEWTKSGCSSPNVKINIFRNSITQANFVLQLTGPNSGTYNWTVPADFPTGNYALRVKQDPVVPGEEGCQGDSGVFQIAEPSGTPGKPDYKMKATHGIPVDKLKYTVKKPEITWAGTGSVGKVILKPGSLLNVKGLDFGTEKGKILMRGYFEGGIVELEKVHWLNHLQAYGYVPNSLNGWPQTEVEIMIETAAGVRSEPWEHKLVFNGREEKVLTSDAVGVICGLDGNSNICNKVWTSDTGYTMAMPVEHAISGYHSNAWGAVGDDTGDDIYTIDLKNGWKLKSIQVVKWEKSSDGEVLSGPTPPFPAGSSTWTATIHWLVTPNDSVRYELKIIVDGPIGTDYK